MENRYNITGTPNDLQKLLQSEFSMSTDQAKFSLTILLLDCQREMSIESKENENRVELWYLNEDREHFSTPFFNSRYSISFTEIGKKLLEELFAQFASILVGDVQIAHVIFSCLLAIYRSGTHIMDSECCTYYQALRWKATRSSQEYFTAQNILPNTNDGVCCYLDCLNDGKWMCNYCHGENCSVSIEYFESVLRELARRNVFEEYNGMYRFKV